MPSMKRRVQLGGPAALVLALALIGAIAAACTVIAGEPVAGWPALQTVEHYVPHHEMRERCSRYVAFGMAPEACAEVTRPCFTSSMNCSTSLNSR